MKRIFLFSLSLLLLAACEKAALTTGSDSADRAVVESFLQPGLTPVVLVKKQLLYGSEDTVQAPIQELAITITDAETGAVYPLTHTDTSAYEGQGWQPESGKTYQLTFAYNGKTITAETVIPTKPEGYTASATTFEVFDPSDFDPTSGGTPPSFPDPIELTWDASDGGYYLVVVETAEDSPELIFSDTTRFRPFRAFRSTPEQTNTHRLEPMSFRYYGLHHVILYHLNPEYAALYDYTGNTSTNLTTPYTNVIGGLGIFTGVNADTINVTVTK